MYMNEADEHHVRQAVEAFSSRFGAEATARLAYFEGRILCIEFLGHMCATCGVTDYLDDFVQELEEASGTSYAVWEYAPCAKQESRLIAKFAKLDFLGDIREAMEKAGPRVKQRMQQFQEQGKDEESLFSELCFCILTANFRADAGIRIQESVGEGFCNLGKEPLAQRLRSLGHRFPEARAGYIVESRRLRGKLGNMVGSYVNGADAREWLVDNVKGLGYKEASHFLRNIGVLDVAIIDRHILRFLLDKRLITEIPKSLNRRKYIEIERLLSSIAAKLGLTLGELDLYIWYVRTGKVLK
jgi:N-glycosylase/DNA lyase